MTKKEKNLLIRIIISLVLFILGIFIKNNAVQYILLGIAYLSVGYSVVKKAVLRMFRGKFFDENFLMMIATFGAVFVGEYTEAVAVMLFYQIGELFQSYSVGKSRRSISELMEICPEYANIIRDGEVVEADVEEVVIGDILLVKQGEKVPVDGTVIEGKTSFNTAPLTGESIPCDRSEGDFVSSGFINLSGLVKIRAEKEFSDSTVAKILELVENSSLSKAKTEKFITRFSYYYTPAVVILALLLALIPPIFLGNFSMWFHRALTFLVVSCPCALVISVPLSFFGGIGGASRNGILIKGTNYIETLSKCKTVAFDKTGTLTKGEFEVTAVKACNMEEDRFIEILSAVEGGSNHPIAKAIVRKFGNVSGATDVEEIPGRGITAIFDGKRILAGNESLMAENTVNVSESEENGAMIYLAVDGVFAGYAVVSDLIKPEAKQAIEGLYKKGITKTIMLTGDRKKNAKAIAKALSIKEFKAELMPKDKAEMLKVLMKKDGGKTAFVGDGINDAPVLALVDVGIAMGSIGSDAAIEAADVVVMDDNLLKIPLAVKIAKKTMRIVKQNIVFALGVKGMILILGALGAANMWAAVFADVGVAVIAILNAMRTLKKCS